jgi:hypothetical protein
VDGIRGVDTVRNDEHPAETLTFGAVGKKSARRNERTLGSKFFKGLGSTLYLLAAHRFAGVADYPLA